MKKVLALVLALVLVFSLTACGGGESLTGCWKITSFTIDGKDQLASEGFSLSELEAKGLYFGIEAKDDKTAVMKFMGEEEKFTWDSKNLTADGVSNPYTIKDGVLTMTGEDEGKKNVMTFKKMTDEEAKKFKEMSAEELQKAVTEIVMAKLMEQLGNSEDSDD